VWIGIDVGKGHHWATAVDDVGQRVWTRKVLNDEGEIMDAITEGLGLAETVVWAVDVCGSASALLLAGLTARGQEVLYVPGRTVNSLTTGYRGEAKTDAKDSFVIAEAIRLRRDFASVQGGAGLLTKLEFLTGHRADMVADRVRLINRLRDLLTGAFPALERTFDFSRHRGAVVLLTGYQSPAALRRRGQARVEAWLRVRGVRSAEKVAAKALAAAATQHIDIPGHDVIGGIIADLATQLLALDERLARVDKQIHDTFAEHPQAEVITSLPGMGVILGAEFVVAAGDLSTYADAGRLASAAGLVPVPKDSGRRTGNLHRPQRYSRRLRRALYLSAQTSIVREGPNRDYYLKKRGEGRTHIQAVIALARRRVDVLWALLREDRKFTSTPPVRPIAA